MKKSKAVKSWTLLDVVKQNKRHPDTFLIPEVTERNNLVPGMDAKLVFQVDYKTHEVSAERMWVKVTKVIDTGEYEGTLDNDPIVIDDLHFGKKIKFAAKHVASIMEIK